MNRIGKILKILSSCQKTHVRFLIETGLRVDGSGMKSHCASAPTPPELLQPVRHEKIERMNTRRQGVEQKETKGTKKFPILVCFVFFCKSFCLFGSAGDFPVRPPP